METIQVGDRVHFGGRVLHSIADAVLVVLDADQTLAVWVRPSMLVNPPAIEPDVHVTVSAAVLAATPDVLAVELWSKTDQYSIELPSAAVLAVEPYADPEFRDGYLYRDIEGHGPLWLCLNAHAPAPFLPFNPFSPVTVVRTELPRRVIEWCSTEEM